MTKQEILDRFRQENPDITDRVISDTVLESWAEIGEAEIAVLTRAIRGFFDFSSVAGEDTYNLVDEEPNFYDIDEFPGGGVSYDNKRVDLITMGLLDEERPSWRTASNGTPITYVRYNDEIVFDRPASSAVTIRIYAVLKSNAFNNNTLIPFNELRYLDPFHYSIVLYLTKRAKWKIAKNQDAKQSEEEYMAYVKWMKSEINRGIFNEIKMRPPFNTRGYRRNR